MLKKTCQGICLIFSCLWLTTADVWSQDSLPQPQEVMDFANGLFERGMYAMAIAEYQEFIDNYTDHPDQPKALFGIAESHFFDQQYELAITIYDQFLTKYKDHELFSVVLLRNAQSQFFQNEKDPQSLDPLLDLSVENLSSEFQPIHYYFLGTRSRLKKDVSSALIHYEQAIVLNPQHRYSIYSSVDRAELLMLSQRWDEAAKQYQQLLEIEIDDDIKALSRYKLGEIYFEQKKFNQVIPAYKEFLNNYPDHERSQDAINRLLASYFETERFLELTLIFKELTATYPQILTAFKSQYIYALSLAQIKKDGDALQIFDELLARSDINKVQRQNVYLRRIEIFLQQQDFESIVAMEDFSEMIQGADQEDKFIFFKAEALYGLEKYAKAAELYQQIFEQFPDSELLQDALYGLAYAKNMAGELDQAAAMFRQYQSTAKDPIKVKNALYNEILLAAKVKQYPTVIKRSQDFLNQYPDDDKGAVILFRLGHAFSETKQHKKANKHFTRFIKQFSDDDKVVQVLFLKAFNHQALEEIEEAIKTYDQILTVKSATSDDIYSALKNKALVYIQNESEVQATAAFFDLMVRYPSNDLDGKTYLWVAERLLKDERYNDVILILEQLEQSSRQSDPEKVAYFKAEAHRGAENFRQAIKFYDDVLTIKDNGIYSGASYIGKGLSLMEIQEYEWAKFEFDAAIVKNPDDTTITMRARFELAQIELKLVNLQAAQKMFMLVAVLYDHPFYTPESLFQAGALFETMDKYEQARNVYEELITNYPQSPRVADARARLNYTKTTL